MKYAIAVHGGCGRWPASQLRRALVGVRAALEAGRRVLAAGGSALEAVCIAVERLEDDPLFNAGTGAARNRDGEIEMDACVMDGASLACGAVGAIRRVKNPVRVALAVMQHTRHVLLVGDGALAFARERGFTDYDPARPQSSDSPGTVGAVARDRSGCFAAATSTGGLAGKLSGRVGDSAIPGAGNYANSAAAASATGRGELMMRTLATFWACERIAAGTPAMNAVQRTLARLPAGRDDSAGIIALGRGAAIGVAARGGVMPHAFCIEGSTRVAVRAHPR